MMKVVCDSVAIADMLKRLSSISGPLRNVLPFKGAVLLDAGEKLVGTTSDMGDFVSMSIEAQTQEAGRVLVPCRFLSDVLASVAEQGVSISLESHGHDLSVECQNQVFTLKGLDAQEFPDVWDVDVEPVQLSREVFDRVVRQVCPFVAPDATRPVLESVLLDIVKGGKMNFVATDGYKMAVLSLDCPGDMQESVKGLVPGAKLRMFARLISGDGPVSVAIRGNRAKVSSGDVVFRMVGVVGGFPSYEMLVPKGHAVSLKASRGDVLKALKVLMVSGDYVRCAVSNGLPPHAVHDGWP